MSSLATPPELADVRQGPAPLRGGPLALLRFMRRNHMLTMRHCRLILRWLWLKLRWDSRLRTNGLCFIDRDVKLEIGRNAYVQLGRWSWLGEGTKIRAHEGSISIGAKTVLGQGCTLSAYQHISIGRECVIADRVMFIDFDHNIADIERPIREQGIDKRNVYVGHNAWLGHAACILRGVRVGNNSVVGANAVVTKDIPDNVICGGVPAKVIRERDRPEQLRWS